MILYMENKYETGKVTPPDELQDGDDQEEG
jgi:hypothetical protein